MGWEQNLLLLASFGLLVGTAWAGDRPVGRGFAGRSEVIGENGMAATSQPLATQAAIEILKQGGTAVDAAIGANAMLGLTEPTGCGVGGDLFAIVWDAGTRKLYGLNASGRSPRGLHLEHFRKLGLKRTPAYGPLPVTVPGAVDGWFELHGRFGKLPMGKILQPAIDYAEKGFPVTEVIAHYWKMNVDRLKKFENFKRTFTIRGRAPKTGQIFKNPDLARTYRLIAEGGRDVFYKGKIAKTIDAYMKRVGGFLRHPDLSGHKSEWVEPVSTTYRGYRVWELPPNGQGIAALQILNILEAYDIEGMGFGSPEYVHLFLEAKKLAFADRARYYADPEFNRIPVKELISKKYASGRRKLIKKNQAMRAADAGELQDGDTIYLTVADRDGNMVSLIQSNYRGMGSGLVADGLGFVFQDRGELFNLAEGHFNSYAPGKRPFHTIIPAFVTRKGKPCMSFGVMGGAAQPQMHVQVLINIIDFGMNLQEAGDAPRVLHTGSSQPTGEVMQDGGRVHLEEGFSDNCRKTLQKKGHRIEKRDGGFGGYQAIRRDHRQGVYYGASESRKDGQATGY